MLYYTATTAPATLTVEQIAPEVVTVSWTPSPPSGDYTYLLTVNSTTTSAVMVVIINPHIMLLQPGVYSISVLALHVPTIYSMGTRRVHCQRYRIIHYDDYSSLDIIICLYKIP